MSKTLKKIIIALVVIVLIGVGASFFAGGDTQIQNPLQSTMSGNTAAPLATQNTGISSNTEQINREFVSTLLNLESINLEDDIFSEPAFSALVDNTVRLNQPGNEGRPNPFAPIGTDTLSNNRIQNQASVVDALPQTQVDTEEALNNPIDPLPSVQDEELSNLGAS